MDEIQELRQLTISGVTYQIIPESYGIIYITDISGKTWEVMGKRFIKAEDFGPGDFEKGDFGKDDSKNGDIDGEASGDTVGGETIKPVDGETLP